MVWMRRLTELLSSSPVWSRFRDCNCLFNSPVMLCGTLCCAVLCRREGESRVVACMQLKPAIQAVRVLAVARGLIRPVQLPPSCRDLKTPAQLPQMADGVQWVITWTDTALRHKPTGLIR